MSTLHKATLFNGDIAVTSVGNPIPVDGNTGSVYLNVTTAPPAGTMDVTIEEKDQVTGQWYLVATFAQVTTSTTNEKVPIVLFYGKTLRATATVASVTSPNVYSFVVGYAGKS